MAARLPVSVLFRQVVCLVVIAAVGVTGSLRPAHAFTIGEEREIGEKLLYQVRQAFPIVGDPDLHQYLNGLGQEVLDVAGLQFFDYRFFIVESKQFNAFAAPSGLIFFYTELISSMNSEDELVSVIAHEIGHVVKRHLASRMKKGTIVNIATLGAALAAIALGGGGAASQALLAGSLAAGQSAQLYFSREDEKEADLLAYNWLKELNRNPEGQKAMLQTMRRITRYRMGQVPQYLLTHPDPEARLDYVESLMNAEGLGGDTVPGQEEQDFAFLRFKYRIMTQIKDNRSVRAYLANKLQDQRSSSFARNMARYGLAQLDFRENNYEQALDKLNHVISALPHKPILFIDKAVILASQGEFEQARTILDEAYRRQPQDMYAAYQLAHVSERLGDLEGAERLLRQVAFSMPEFSKVYFDLGRILSARGETAQSRFFLGKFNLYEGKLKLAEENFREARSAPGITASLKMECEELLALIERLQKG